MTAEKLVELLKEKNLTISSAESLTGGLFTKTITDIPGSSAVLNGGIVSYTNEVKMDVLGVPEEVIEEFTEVSAECAEKMACGAARLFQSDIAISFTGYAGPTGGNENDPVGTAYICVYYSGEAYVLRKVFSGRRQSVREQCVDTAICMIAEVVEKI